MGSGVGVPEARKFSRKLSKLVWKIANIHIITFQKFQEIFSADLVKNIRILKNSL